jgi:hypothetical protein
MLLRSKTNRVAALVCAAASVPAFSDGQEAPSRATILIKGPASLDVSVAAYDAVRRLREPRCQEILDDFTDAAGRPVRESLGASTPDAYLARLVIRDGEFPRDPSICTSQTVAAFTANGAAVFVCGTTFRRLPPGERANALIHEMLHTLGLRENPPTAIEISRRVRARCGG